MCVIEKKEEEIYNWKRETEKTKEREKYFHLTVTEESQSLSQQMKPWHNTSDHSSTSKETQNSSSYVQKIPDRYLSGEAPLSSLISQRQAAPNAD